MPKPCYSIAMQPRERRSTFDNVVIRLFPKVFNRWMCAHLSAAFAESVIDSRVLHALDAQMKSDLEQPGFVKPQYAALSPEPWGGLEGEE